MVYDENMENFNYFSNSTGFGPSAGFPPTNHISNGILVGPGGPTGVIGRPYGGSFGGYGNQYPQQFGGHPGAGYGNGPGFGGFDGLNNGIGGGPYGWGGSPYGGNNQFDGSPYNQFRGQGGFQRPLFDSAQQNSPVKKIEKSAK